MPLPTINNGISLSALAAALNNHPPVTANNTEFSATCGNATWLGNTLTVSNIGVNNCWNIPAIVDKVSYCVVPGAGAGDAYVISPQYGGCEYHELYNAAHNLLAFLRAYAISTTFHSEDTVKFRSTFNRNLTLYNSIVLDNEEAFVGRQDYDSPRNEMRNQDGDVFQPAHDVFGGQTGTEASGNPSIFKSAYDAAGLYTTTRLARNTLTYDTDTSGTAQATWDKDWGSVIPTNGNGEYVVGDVAVWLWQRIVGDGGKNFDVIARAQVLALLARSQDFGYAVTVINPEISTNPEATYSSLELTGDADLVDVMAALAAETMALDDSNVTGTRRTANRRVSYAANFIAMLPYTFAMEGK